MKNETHSNTALFLMELIMVIGFFSLVSTVCMQLFSSASRASTQSVRLNHALRLTESLAETWIAKDGDLEALSRLYPGGTLRTEDGDPRTGTLTLCYDGDWQATSPDSGSMEFLITVDSRLEDAAALYGPETSGSLAVRSSITASASDGTVICTLTPDHYIGASLPGSGEDAPGSTGKQGGTP